MLSPYAQETIVWIQSGPPAPFGEPGPTTEVSVKAALERGVALAAMFILNHATLDIPRVPLDEGTLRGSGSIFVDGVLKGVSAKVNGQGEPCTSLDEAIVTTAVSAVIGWNTPYAAHLHENPQFNFGYAHALRIVDGNKNLKGMGAKLAATLGTVEAGGTGGKWLSIAFARHKDECLQIVGAEVWRALAA